MIRKGRSAAGGDGARGASSGQGDEELRLECWEGVHMEETFGGYWEGSSLQIWLQPLLVFSPMFSGGFDFCFFCHESQALEGLWGGGLLWSLEGTRAILPSYSS